MTYLYFILFPGEIEITHCGQGVSCLDVCLGSQYATDKQSCIGLLVGNSEEDGLEIATEICMKSSDPCGAYFLPTTTVSSSHGIILYLISSFIQ